jgi:hypothetical protein
MRALRQVESPTDTVKRRMTNHVDWWKFRVRRSLGMQSEPESYRAHDRDPWRAAGTGSRRDALPERRRGERRRPVADDRDDRDDAL